MRSIILLSLVLFFNLNCAEKTNDQNDNKNRSTLYQIQKFALRAVPYLIVAGLTYLFVKNNSNDKKPESVQPVVSKTFTGMDGVTHYYYASPDSLKDVIVYENPFSKN